MVILPAFEAKGRLVVVVKATVTTAVVTCSAFLSTDAMVIDTDVTPDKAGAVAPALAASVAVCTVKPVADPAVAAPVVSSPAAKVILCAPGAKSAFAVWQTMVRVAAVKVQVDVSVAVPVAGTRTPAGVALALK